MATPLQQRHSERLAKHQPVHLGAQLSQLPTLVTRERGGCAALQQTLMPASLARVHGPARHGPQVFIAELDQPAQVVAVLRGDIVQRRREIAANGLQQNRIERQARCGGEIPQPLEERVRQLDRQGLHAHGSIIWLHPLTRKPLALF